MEPPRLIECKFWNFPLLEMLINNYEIGVHFKWYVFVMFSQNEEPFP